MFVSRSRYMSLFVHVATRTSPAADVTSGAELANKVGCVNKGDCFGGMGTLRYGLLIQLGCTPR